MGLRGKGGFFRGREVVFFCLAVCFAAVVLAAGCRAFCALFALWAPLAPCLGGCGLLVRRLFFSFAFICLGLSHFLSFVVSLPILYVVVVVTTSNPSHPSRLPFLLSPLRVCFPYCASYTPPNPSIFVR